MTEYRILPTVIERSGYTHKLIERNGMIAIYESYLLGKPKKLYGYCVARITREKEARFKNGHIIPARERFPSPSRFGTYGFFYIPRSRHKAFEQYQELVRKFSTPYPPENPTSSIGNTITRFDEENEQLGGGRGCRMKAIRAEELLDRKISRFNSVRSKTSSSDYSLREFLSEVQG